MTVLSTLLTITPDLRRWFALHLSAQPIVPLLDKLAVVVKAGSLRHS